MRIYDIIMKKKKGEELTRGEISEFIRDYTDGKIPDYQVAALLMAICLNGMSDAETFALTDAIAHSGDTVDLSEFGDLSVDKHSTGGVGDKTTPIIASIAAALGCKVAKMSGRGLGHTGGTIDKLESIPGYKVSLSPDEFLQQVRDVGVAVIGQSGNLAPADKKLYALRDVTATVDSIPLITSSVMGKKLAAGSHSIVLDVKCGSGAFVKTREDAERLAASMVAIGEMAGRKTSALITDMDVPLGNAIGNILEVKEVIETLKNRGPRDLTEICIQLASNMVQLALNIDKDDAEARVCEALHSGAALKKFKEWIGAQGGRVDFIDDPGLFDTSAIVYCVMSETDGYIERMDAEAIGLAAMELGAGRKSKDDKIDYTAGIVLKKKTGDIIKAGDVIATFYTNKRQSIEAAERIFRDSITLSFIDNA